MKDNKTRFVLLGRKQELNNELSNKASLKFELNHDIGSLSNVLQLFSTFKINLTKIQSLPVIGSPWQYAFFVDVLFEDYQLFSEVTTMLEKAVKKLKIIGVYRSNKENKKSELISSLRANLQGVK